MLKQNFCKWNLLFFRFDPSMSGQLFTIYNFAGLPVFVLKFSEHFPSEPGRKQINHERDPNKNSGKNMVSWRWRIVPKNKIWFYKI